MRRRILFLFLSFTSLIASAQQQPTYDVLIRNGKIVDGSGNPWYYGDVGIIDDRIAYIGNADKSVTARRTIDAKGLIVAPGFIDMLGQSEVSLLIDKQAFSKITQGVTTEITGEGGSIAPLNQKQIDDSKPFTDHFHLTLDWQSLDEYFSRLRKQGSGVNLGTYIGATQVREYVIGDDDRPPTADELKLMKQYVEDGMQAGALGLSTSLIYAPAFYAKTEELIELAKVAAQYGGVYATHMRNEGDHEMEAIDEALRIGREAHIPVEIFHLKVAGRQNWGKMREVIAKLEKARAEGVDVTADQYPYVAGATSLGAAVPPKYHDGGTEKFIARLKDPQQRAAIKADLENSGDTPFEKLWYGSGGADGVLILSVLQPELKPYEGKTVKQAAEMMGKDPFDALFDMLITSQDTIGAAFFIIGEEDLRFAMQQPWVSVGTDHGEVNITGPLSEGKAHPRGYGSFPRILGKYVREEKLLRMEDAVRKMTSLAANRVKLDRRGLLRPDYFADITIFDPEKVIDVATFENPNRPSIGIQYVLVNGVVEIDDGKVTGNVGGRPLLGSGLFTKAPEDPTASVGRVQGIVTSEDGYPLGRTSIKLLDASGQTVSTGGNNRDGKFSLRVPSACKGCRLIVERPGFQTAERKVDYNGTNSLWFSFALNVQKNGSRKIAGRKKN